MSRRSLISAATAVVVSGMFLTACGTSSGNGGDIPADAVAGLVADVNGPVAGATVKIQATQNEIFTDASGKFMLRGLPPGKVVNISAWKDGYNCALAQNVVPPDGRVHLELIRYQLTDNPRYEWLAPEGAGDLACVKCHAAITRMWLESAHAKAAKNPRFLTMYNGTDTLGNKSPQTVFVQGTGPWKGRPVALPPDPARPYYGPGVRLDEPSVPGPGTCSACHTPGASVAYDVDPTTVTGADQYGVHCDYCHKVANVNLFPTTGMPNPNLPGVHSSDVRRPFTDDPVRPQLFLGPYNDVNVAENETYLPLMKESRFCADCHFGSFWGTVVYDSYGEWARSPYSDPTTGKTCQACHMPAPTVYEGREITNFAPGKGGVERNPATIPQHKDLGLLDQAFMKAALTMSASAERAGGEVAVRVDLTNDNTGHHIPTDSPLRQLILLVSATNSGGNALIQLTGPTVPDWAGRGKPGDGYYAGLPGKGYAKILQEVWTGVIPTGAYWDPTIIVSDNRLAAFESDATSYSFDDTFSGVVEVRVTLLYRRAYKNLIDWKKWDLPDIVMSEKSFLLELR